ncbi:BEN domain-containing protein 5-like [Pseudochaenichthys georgianus]|uniref:BEN domain-containing protein 5-like n=1 Tax=Pseudochaenichthys georgianus TaxID=52239 RepID=UPI0039C2B228
MKPEEPSEIPEQCEPAPWTPTHPNNSPSKSEPHGKIVVIDLQGEIPVRPEVWAKIKNNTRDSMFVKELAVAFWGTDTLGERSLTGKECPTTKTTRQPLTPQKLSVLKVCFKQWLYEKDQ